ncbi:MAG: hypothetical protein O9284_05470 [Steroidobacteraceae bacterium]|jgi:hypothetical protein|nr:hypothetical protein [Steroidobacteraceae bacterium]
MRRPRGFALVIALAILALTAVLALAAAQDATLGLRMAAAGLARLQLFAAADDALERELGLRASAASEGITRETLASGIAVTVEIRRDRLAGLTAPPGGGYSVALGGPGFGAEHRVARATAVDPRGGRVVLEQQYHLVVPRSP